MQSLQRLAPFQHALEGTAPPCPLGNAALVSIIVPMLNEVDNVDSLLFAIIGAIGLDFEFEILVADGGSTDGTVERVRRWQAVTNVCVVTSDGTRGLAGDVLAAAAMARGDIAVVMDADHSHPPGRLGALVQPILDSTSDMVVGSRFVPGGATPDWPLRRRILSRLGALLAWPLTDIEDPMSGFFAVRRERLLAVDPEAAGFKIGLEVIAHGGGALKVSEIPITFMDRLHGESKISKTQLVAYLRRIFVLAGGTVSSDGAARFAAVGLIGMFVDFLVFGILSALGVALTTAHIAGFCIATVSNYSLNSRWAFAERAAAREERAIELYLRFFTVCLLALGVRGGVIAGASEILGLPAEVGVLCGIGAAAIISYLGAAFFVFPSLNPRVPRDIRWRIAAIGVATYVIVLGLLFLGLVDLLPQEAYYWNYAQHLDIGYLDHPPLVAWLIWAGTGAFGDNEFGVRIFAWFSWLVTAFFSFLLTHRLFGKSAAFVSVLLVPILPFYFATGFFMTPDAPLAAAWAGALYFLERTLVGEQRKAWWGVGICIALGMLSKYTIALLLPATLLFMLVDARARAWLLRPEPYLAAILVLLIFSPVIYWNLQNDWASFAFQSTRRIASTFQFALPTLITNTAILLTPLGLIAAGIVLWGRHGWGRVGQSDEQLRRISRFILVFTLVPLAVFIAFSLSRGVKLNWTGPVWLAVIPAFSAVIVSGVENSSAVAITMRRVLAQTAAIGLVAYGLALNYLVLSAPGIGYAVSLPGAPVAWSEFGREAAALKREVKQAFGRAPLMIGLDTYNIASVLAFYVAGDSDETASSVGRGILGRGSLMYERWYTAEPLRGRPAIMFAFKRSQIVDPTLANHFATLSDPIEREILKGGKPAGRFYYRIGHDFQGAGSPTASDRAAGMEKPPGTSARMPSPSVPSHAASNVDAHPN